MIHRLPVAPIARCFAIAALLAVPAMAEVDPRLLSAWQAVVTDASGTWILQFRPEYDGRYATRVTGPAPMPDETGVIEASDGRWSVNKDDGNTDEGTYVFVTPDVVSFTGRSGTVVWQRQSSLPSVNAASSADSPSAVGPPVATSSTAPPAAIPLGDWPPGGLPARAETLLARARDWQADAVLQAIETDLIAGGSAVVANLETPSGRATLKFVYCSPSTKKRLVVSPGMPFGEDWEGESPRCSADRVPPASFLDLPDAVARARSRGMVDGDPQSASLDYVSGVEGESESGWMWRIHPPRYSNDRVYEIPVAAPAVGTVRHIDACALLTAADAAALIGSAASADPGHLVASTWGCAWQAPGDNARHVSLVVDDNPHRDAAGYIDKRLVGGRTAIDELGDRAVLFDSPAGVASLDILLDETLLQLSLARPGGGRADDIVTLGRQVVSRFGEGHGISEEAGPLAKVQGTWIATGAGLSMRVGAYGAFTISVGDESAGGAETLGGGSVTWQSRRARIVFDPSPTLVSAAQKRGLRALYGAMVVEQRRLSVAHMTMQGHDLALVEWSRSDGVTPALPPAGPVPGPSPPSTGPDPDIAAEGAAAAGAPPPAPTAPSSTASADESSDNMDERLNRVGNTLQRWADKAERRIDSFIGRLGKGSSGD